MLESPIDITKSNCVGSPIVFEWNDRLLSKFAYERELNPRLSEALYEINYRANVSLAVSVFEWFVRRFEGIFDLDDAFFRLESAWACTINPHYLNLSAFKTYSFGQNTEGTGGDVLTTGIDRIWKPLKEYAKASIGMPGVCVNLSLLTRHVMADSKAFDTWLESAMRKAASTFPREVASYDSESGVYNFTLEKIVPREFFFDPDFQYSDESATQVLQEFLDSLEPEANPYLLSTDHMKQNGYTREPYKLVDLRKG